jgi:hypothetical protein
MFFDPGFRKREPISIMPDPSYLSLGVLPNIKNLLRDDFVPIAAIVV